MKKSIIIYVIASLIIGLFMGFASCSKDPVNGSGGSLSLASTDQAVTISEDGRSAVAMVVPTGSSFEVTVTASSTWELLKDENDVWCATERNGDRLVVSAVELVSDYTRTAVLRIKVGTEVLGFLTVTQAGTEVAALQLDASEVIFTEMGGAQTVAITTNKPSYTVTGYENSGWLDVVTGEDSFVLTAITNEVAREFELLLTITSGTELNKESVELRVALQAWTPAYINLNRDVIVVPEGGGALEIEVDANREWEVTDYSDWLQIEKRETVLIIKSVSSDGGLQEGSVKLTTTSGRDEAILTVPVMQFSNPFILEYTVPTAGATISAPFAGVVNVYIDWGDGKSTSYSGELAMFKYIEHTYELAGTYNVKMYGEVNSIYSSRYDEALYLTAIIEWGDLLGATDLSYAFAKTSISELPDGYQDIFPRITSFYYTFSGCPKLKTIPADLFNGITATSLPATFANSGLTEIPANLFVNATSLTSVGTTFRGCHYIKSIPEGLFDPLINLEEVVATFDNCIELKTVPAGLFANCPELTKALGLFRESGIQTVEDGFLANNTKLKNTAQMFSNCTSLTTIPERLFENNRQVETFELTFMKCAALTGFSPYAMVGGDKVYLYQRSNYPEEFTNPVGTWCFDRCTSLEDFETMPDPWNRRHPTFN